MNLLTSTKLCFIKKKIWDKRFFLKRCTYLPRTILRSRGVLGNAKYLLTSIQKSFVLKYTSQIRKHEYRKVASSGLVYYSMFDHFWGDANQDVLLSETCYVLQYIAMSSNQSTAILWLVEIEGQSFHCTGFPANSLGFIY